MNEVLRFDRNRLLHETVEDAVLVVDLAAECCFALDGGAPALWPHLVGGTTREALLDWAEAAFDAPPAVVRPAVEAFLDALAAAGVVVQVRSKGAGAPLPQPARRRFEPPRVKRYDDLQALLQSGDDREPP